ncbi:MAG: aminopeptidase [Candidatus Eisenbacteria bacterium]|nr:aminopeptidase [Candidatus Eisenbacteria bacterium]
MTDPRYVKLAGVLVHYCLEIEKGDLFQINCSPLSAPLVREVYREAVRSGAHPFLRVSLPGLDEIFLKGAKKHQLKYVSPIAEFTMENVDKLLSIRASSNTKGLTNTDPQKQAQARSARREIMQRFMERSAEGELMWCGTQFPCNASAQDAEMSLAEYEDFVLRACLVHRKDPIAAWKGVHRKQAKLCRMLGSHKKLRIVSEGTDISMSVEGRKWINSDGKHNMPSGEVFTGPVEDSVEGTISFSFPACYAGKEAHDVRLTFKEGKVVDAKASKGEDFLKATLDTDEGSRYVGEIAVGTNYSVQQFTKNTLFDEKIGGTIHMAVGASYPDSGGQNQSSVHWDMVNDMREGGKIYADGKLVYKDGEFVE